METRRVKHSMLRPSKYWLAVNMMNAFGQMCRTINWYESKGNPFDRTMAEAHKAAKMSLRHSILTLNPVGVPINILIFRFTNKVMKRATYDLERKRIRVLPRSRAS